MLTKFAIRAVNLLMALVAILGVAQGQERVIYSVPGTSEAAPSVWAKDDNGNLYGVTYFNGPSFAGTVFELSPSVTGWNETLLYAFQDTPDGFEPTGLARDAAGNLYGTTIYGGAHSNPQCIHNCGTVFELSPNSSGGWSEAVIYNFTGGEDGGNPQAPVIVDASGNLYGTTGNGGPGQVGVVFELSPSSGSWSYTRLYYFGEQGSHDGAFPSAAITRDAAGNLYGTTPSGGLYEKGIAFKLTSASNGGWKETVLHNFGESSSDGAVPFAGLILDAAGNLYGAASAGGGHCSGTSLGCGTVFRLASWQSGWKETTLYKFAGPPDASSPDFAVVFDGQGNLYGAANGGSASHCQLFGPCGAIFKLAHTTQGWKETVLHSFSGSPDGNQVNGPPMFGKGGLLYGGTTYGGTGACTSPGTGCGAVYVVKP
jgi:uncharacterized repeat protein (TIGR03803 family)